MKTSEIQFQQLHKAMAQVLKPSMDLSWDQGQVESQDQ